MKHVHHSGAHYEGLKKNWGSSVHSSPQYSTYYTLKMFTFDAIPLKNPSGNKINQCPHVTWDNVGWKGVKE